MKLAIINHGVPGSGMSTMAAAIQRACHLANRTCEIFSADDLFMVNGEYKFVGSKLPEYHKNTLGRYVHSMQRHTECVISDNTNIKPEHAQQYRDMAMHGGYKVIVLNFIPSTVKKHRERDIHSVPRSTIHRLIHECRTVPVLPDELSFNITEGNFMERLEYIPEIVCAFLSR